MKTKQPGSRLLAPNTTRAYRAQWNAFVAWCVAANRPFLPTDPATAIQWIDSRINGRIKATTLAIARASIAYQHQRDGYPDPTSTDTFATWWARNTRRMSKSAIGTAVLSSESVRKLAQACDVSTPEGLRDRALVLLIAAGALNRAEVVALDAEAIVWGYRRVTIRSRNVERIIAEVGGPCCPVGALRAWLKQSRISEGPIFVRLDHSGRHNTSRLHDRAVARRVKVLCARVGIDPKAVSASSVRKATIAHALNTGTGLAATAYRAAMNPSQAARQYGSAREDSDPTPAMLGSNTTRARHACEKAVKLMLADGITTGEMRAAFAHVLARHGRGGTGADATKSDPGPLFSHAARKPRKP